MKNYKIGKIFGMDLILKDVKDKFAVEKVLELLKDNYFIYFYDGDEHGHLPTFKIYESKKI